MIEAPSIPKKHRRDQSGRWMIEAPCKLNLGLRIFPPRPDGFHDLESWMVPLSWHDTLFYSPSNQPLNLVISGRAEGIPIEVDKNLVGRAALKLAQLGNIPATGELVLHKVVPPGGGLGGGSSDAAKTLILLNDAWNLNLGTDQLLGLAGQLGSDVPFFIGGKGAFCRGRGEMMSALTPTYPLFGVLILPPQGLATKPVYEAFDAGHRHATQPPIDWQALAQSDADTLNNLLINDLEPPAFHLAPWLRDLQTQAAQILGRKVHMTGSGSTLFTLCGSAPQVENLQKRLEPQLAGLATCVPVHVLR